MWIKTIMRRYYIPIRSAEINLKNPHKKWQMHSNSNSHALKVGTQRPWKRFWQLPIKLNTELPHNPAILLPHTCPSTRRTSAHLKVYVQTCMQMNTTAKSLSNQDVLQKWKDEQTGVFMWWVTVPWLSNKRNRLLIQTWMNLKDLSEKGQYQKGIYVWFHSPTFRKRQNCSDREQSCCCQDCRTHEGETQGMSLETWTRSKSWLWCCLHVWKLMRSQAPG